MRVLSLLSAVLAVSCAHSAAKPAELPPPAAAAQPAPADPTCGVAVARIVELVARPRPEDAGQMPPEAVDEMRRSLVEQCLERPWSGETRRCFAAAADDEALDECSKLAVRIPAPADVAAPPADAEKSTSGLAWKVLRAGTGADKPLPQDSVEVDFTGWTTDGKMFDSSVARGVVARFKLTSIVPGWSEGLQLMVVGEKRRLWIPEALAFQGQEGQPAGMLVIDVELRDIARGPKPIPAPADVAAPPADATRSKSGLAWKIVQKGKGKPRPSAHAIARVHVTSWTPEGLMLGSTAEREPLLVTIDKALPAWAEVLPLMAAGEKRRVWSPQELAGARKPYPRPGEPTVFEIELVSFFEPPTAPADVAAAPKNAKKTASGLASRVLAKGKGKVHPTADDTVEVHYTGWTSDGKMFDSSVTRDRPVRFPLAAVIPGWSEGVRLMVVGEKRRLWLPEELAYKGQQGMPQGMLVFDVELLAINPPPPTEAAEGAP